MFLFCKWSWNDLNWSGLLSCLLSSGKIKTLSSFQIGRIQERFPELHGAALQLLGEALCGCASTLRLHLQQRQGPRGARRAQLVHGSGGVQWRPAGHAQGSPTSPHVKTQLLLQLQMYDWVKNVSLRKYCFFSDSKHVRCVHETSRNPPPGHQRERHERLAVRLQPSSSWNDKVRAVSRFILDSYFTSESKSPSATFISPTDPSWRGGAAA